MPFSARGRRAAVLTLMLSVTLEMTTFSTAASAAPQWRNFPQPVSAPKGAPNVLLVLTDDVGFGSSSTFGGAIPTPTFDALAARGLRYDDLHTTAMCSPTRAALLTGRNAHAVASGSITNVSIDEPGYTSVIPKSAATIARVLKENGYDTAFFGKNHNTPVWEAGPMGPFDRWPNGWGFDYFYGYNAAAEDQFRPALIENRNAVEPPSDPDYIFDKDSTDHLINWLHVQHSEHASAPFFVYLAPGTMHSPHQAPADWVARFKGKFDGGWDKLRAETFQRQKRLGVIPKDAVLTPRPAVLPAWNSLRLEAQRMYAHQMEIAAAQLAFFDFQTGRVLEDLKASGQLDNTLVIFVQGDNGASMDSRLGDVQELQSLLGINPTEDELIERTAIDGTRHSYSNYNAAWAWAQNAPFPWGKQIASHLGGLRDGMVISWPNRIKATGQMRSQFHHVIDIAPTIYEAAGIRPPSVIDGVTQQPIDGVSMVYTFDKADAPSTRREQYFEMLGNRSFYRDGWLASTTPPLPPFARPEKPLDPSGFEWELYDLRKDFSQSKNVAARYPAKLAELKAGFDEAAKRYNVYPMTADLLGRVGVDKRPSVLEGRQDLTFYPGPTRYPQSTFPSLMAGWGMTAEITTLGLDASGPIMFTGDEAGGVGMTMNSGAPVYVYNPTGDEGARIRLAGPRLSAGKHVVRIDVASDASAGPRAARMTMSVDGRDVATAAVPVFYPARGGSVVGRYNVRPITPDAAQPPANRLTVERVNFKKEPTK